MRARTAPPDVSVVIAVYNTMPYLTECLDSLIGQSIGLDRLEIIAVDDGSTDDSPKELARFAAAYPEVVKVITQPNSGGPAAPQNRGIEAARGRFVFFIGADDYLGAEALERMVATADEHGSDIVLGTMVGVNGRVVPKSVFAHGNRYDIGLTDSDLPWALSDTKLFRRALLERHTIRYHEDLTILCDQAFTLECVLRSAKISVLGDYEYYYAVKRDDESNLTYRGRDENMLVALERSMATAIRLGASDEQRTAVFTRYVNNEMIITLSERIPVLERREDQERLLETVGRLIEEYIDEAVLERLAWRRLVRVLLARGRHLDALLEAVRFDEANPQDSTQVIDGRVYLEHPAFRNPDASVEDRWFDRTRTTLNDVTPAWDSAGADAALLLTAHSPAPDYARLWGPHLSVRLTQHHGDGGPASERTFAPAFPGTPADAGTRIRFRIPLAELSTPGRPVAGRWSVRLTLADEEGAFDFPVTAATLPELKLWLRNRYHRVNLVGDRAGRAVLALAQIRATRVIAQRLRRLQALGRK
ncbi:glycosyltransferase family 2 protein [Streptacidiphilus rugosus]|uniref:glycosyltransferase family 2 protein n=1 Tax=Streptacidiphilus rugosus TaxID=405783 RepID=UPI000565682B|nr:glycosyltransferase family 2 protein [Streptacidiphilus rugosus]